MNHCETCTFWGRLPDKVFHPTQWQKPVGSPIVTRRGFCTKVETGFYDPPEDGIACDSGEAGLLTGPKFGCVHHSTL